MIKETNLFHVLCNQAVVLMKPVESDDPITVIFHGPDAENSPARQFVREIEVMGYPSPVAKNVWHDGEFQSVEVSANAMPGDEILAALRRTGIEESRYNAFDYGQSLGDMRGAAERKKRHQKSPIGN